MNDSVTPGRAALPRRPSFVLSAPRDFTLIAEGILAPKNGRRSSAALPGLLAALALIFSGEARAQSFATLYNFTNGNDGANPYCGLVLSSNILYGTAWQGGHLANGTIFAVNTNGGFTLLDTFTGNDGSGPYASMVLSGGTLYGTTVGGGAQSYGTVFKVGAKGTPFTVLHGFTNGDDGAMPYGGVILSGDTLYGTTWQGGGTSGGIVFAVTTNGTGFRIVHNFASPSDGQNIQGGVILSGDTLYGTAVFGGSFGNGTVFSVNTNGTGFTNLYSFTTLNHATNSDGAFPFDGLVLSGGSLCGTAGGGGLAGNGTVFSVNTNGTGFAVLHTFAATSTSTPNGPNSDGTVPMAGLLLSGNTLYGTATDGGSGAAGTVFAVHTDGTGFGVLYAFPAVNPTSGTNAGGATPQGNLVLAGSRLYGTTFEGGGSGYGTVFSLLVRPELSASGSGTNLILTWPAASAGFTLQAATNLGPGASWTPVSPGPVVVNGQNTVTNAISGGQTFFRLSQ